MTTPQEVIEDISANAFQILSRDDKPGLAKLIIAKLRAAGFEIVPKEPTQEMIEAGDDTGHTIEAMSGHPEREEQIANFYRAMIGAASKDK